MAMKAAAFNDRIRDHLYPYFEHKHYELEDGRLVFRRKTSFGHSEIIINVIKGDVDAAVDFHLGLRHDLVEIAMSGLFGQRDYYLRESATLLTDLRLLTKLPSEQSVRRPVVSSLDETEALCDCFIDFMDRKGFAFLAKYAKLASLGHLFNDKTRLSAEYCNHSYQRCFRGMTIAEILGRADLAALREKHRSYLRSRGYAGNVIHKFDTNFARTGQISLN